MDTNKINWLYQQLQEKLNKANVITLSPDRIVDELIKAGPKDTVSIGEVYNLEIYFSPKKSDGIRVLKITTKPRMIEVDNTFLKVSSKLVEIVNNFNS